MIVSSTLGGIFSTISVAMKPGATALTKIAGAGIANVTPIDCAQAAELGGTIDRVFALNVLHELGDRALADLDSLLRPGGCALIVHWNGDIERPVGPPRAHATTLFLYHYALTCAAAGIATTM
jgi:hypothetical protein